jgi:hypothetical protein
MLSGITMRENYLGQVFQVSGKSMNTNPLGPLTMNIVDISPNTPTNAFKLIKFENNNTWYLECKQKLQILSVNEETGSFLMIKKQSKLYLIIVLLFLENTEPFEITLSLSESENLSLNTDFDQLDTLKSLTTEMKVKISLIGDDKCAPKFNEEIYEFFVVENQAVLLENIEVTDCDQGINGKIQLATNDSNFYFKMDNFYKYGKTAIQMSLGYDYEWTKEVVFEIYARGIESSLKKHFTKAIVKIYITSFNEFIPNFILPQAESKNAKKYSNFSFQF